MSSDRAVPHDASATTVRASLSTRMDPDAANPLIVAVGASSSDEQEDRIVSGVARDGDGEPASATLTWSDHDHARLVEADPSAPTRSADSPASISIVVGPPEPSRDGRGAVLWEVLIDGWRIEVEVEPERQALLRERARRSSEGPTRGATAEVRAIIPGRVVSVAVAAGDSVTAGQQVLVVEAMKMQNELRTARAGTVARVAVAAGDTIDAGDLLLVLE